MDAHPFDAAIRARSTTATRRGVFGLAAVLAALAPAIRAPAKPARKPRRNAFGCVDVGKPCRGKDRSCCSGICSGPKPKKGGKDRSRCAAHHEGGCTPSRSLCSTGSAASYCRPGDPTAVCVATTGKAGFCASNAGLVPEVNCRACRTDRQCEGFGFPPGSACVILTGPGCVGPSDCNGVNGSTGTACVPPGA